MPVAVDQKATRQRLDNHPRLAPRLAKKRKAPVTLGEDAAEAMLLNGFSEREYRERLWIEFSRFARSHHGYVVSRPFANPARVQVPAENTSFENAMASLPRYRLVKLGSLSSRLAHQVWQTMRELEIWLWPR
jgi:hypothetical protein